MTYMMRDMPRDDRPRERMLTHGARTLSDAELLAVILGTGVEGKSAVYLARELLGEGLQNLCRLDPTLLAHARGVGPVKAARIAAAVELAQRMFKPPLEEPPLYDAGKVGEDLVKKYGMCGQERFGAVLVDARHRIMKQHEIFIGTLDRTIVSTREVIRLAVVERAKAVVLFHNHPSGDPTPSEEDVVFTAKLRDALEMADIDLLDHLVIGDHRFASMKARNEWKGRQA
ncbi:MAG TPA: DNA repair protein RadC [Thermoanaerobaculia bacterium]|nr:DNA repair protein RadC [Thermoanaerobaculia bacterium]